MKTRLSLLATVCALMLSSTASAQESKYPQRTSLPVIYITTPDGGGITSKDVYKTCTLVYRDGDSLAIYEGTKVRGRGNSTWENSDKKPYRLKFAESQKFLGKGFAKNKSWTLLANAGDKSMIRNAITYHLGKFVGLDFCPAARFVDLYLDGSYRGIYQISDHVNVDNKRIEIDELTGLYYEFNQAEDKTEEPNFKGKYGWMEVKNPDPASTSDMEFAEEYITDARTRLLNSNFTTYADPRNGYRARIDTASLINWYVASEITTNWDALYSFKSYMERDGKLCFGPLWDEDLGWNNNSEVDLASVLIAEKTAIPGYSNLRPLTELTRKLWKDPWFANAVTMKLNQLITDGIEDHLLHNVDSLADILASPQVENYRVWPINSSSIRNMDRYHSFQSYSQYIDQLKDFIRSRLSYLQTAFSQHNASNRYLDEDANMSFSTENDVSIVLRFTAHAGTWNTICLPFSLSRSEISRVFGDNTKVARFTSVTGNTMNFTTANSIEAGVPYIVKPTLDVVEPFSFYQTDISTISPETVTYSGYSFVGTFTPSMPSDNQTLFIDENGKLCVATQTGVKKGFRAYVKIPANTKTVCISVDGVQTGISNLVGDVNIDGKVDISDVTTLIDVILGKNVYHDHDAADVNIDGKVDISDVTLLIDIILGK